MDVVLAPGSSLTALTFIAGGVALGTVSGLVPGLHANNMALLMAGVAPSIPGPSLYVGMAMLAAGVVHTFLDVVPALALGVPDPAMAVVALPGHRLVLEGRGREALRLSALGSGVAVALALPLAIPVTAVMTSVWPTMRTHLSVILAGVAILLVATEHDRRSRIVGGVSFLASAALGIATLDLDPAAPIASGGILAPIFAGLFGAPVLVDAIGGAGVPPQADSGVALSRSTVGIFGGLGTLAGAIVGYVPAVSSAIASTFALLAIPDRSGAREFVVTTSGVNTANTIFALFALVAIGSPRTGVLVALDRVGAPLVLSHLLAAVAIAAGLGFVLVIVLGDRYLAVVGRIDATRLSVAVLIALGGLSYLFAGPLGVGIYVASAIIGLVPARFGARRATLMGVLIGPIALS